MHARRNFHAFVSDGESRFHCFDEHDTTCETDFLRSHRGWTRVSSKGYLAVAVAPTDEGVKFHVIAGKEMSQKVKPATSQPVIATSKVKPQSRGPLAVGEEVGFDVSVHVGAGQLRPCDHGQLVLSDVGTAAEFARFPVESFGGRGRRPAPRADRSGTRSSARGAARRGVQAGQQCGRAGRSVSARGGLPAGLRRYAGAIVARRHDVVPLRLWLWGLHAARDTPPRRKERGIRPPGQLSDEIPSYLEDV